MQGQLYEAAHNNEILNAQVQELVELLKGSNADRNILEANLVEANKTINDLHVKVQPQDERNIDYINQITKLRCQLVEQTAMLTKTHHELQQEVSQRRKT